MQEYFYYISNLVIKKLFLSGTFNHTFDLSLDPHSKLTSYTRFCVSLNI
ncbi:hypothetical protein L3i20_v211180 [Paenibacillus sp. L3-i20]|nr:hypothetical protein L3i20_v211180 [Paenibacillus sp. L3-i20]